MSIVILFLRSDGGIFFCPKSDKLKLFYILVWANFACLLYPCLTHFKYLVVLYLCVQNLTNFRCLFCILVNGLTHFRCLVASLCPRSDKPQVSVVSLSNVRHTSSVLMYIRVQDLTNSRSVASLSKVPYTSGVSLYLCAQDLTNFGCLLYHCLWSDTLQVSCCIFVSKIWQTSGACCIVV